MYKSLASSCKIQSLVLLTTHTFVFGVACVTRHTFTFGVACVAALFCKLSNYNLMYFCCPVVLIEKKCGSDFTVDLL